MGFLGGGQVLGVILRSFSDMGVSENKRYLILGSLKLRSYYLGYYIGVPDFRKPPHIPYDFT